MLKTLRKFLPKTVKSKIMNSLIWRIFTRIQLYRHEVRISCEVTTRCNLRCFMCTRQALLEKKELYNADMESEVIDRVVEEISKFHKSGKKVYFVPMGLGDPLLYRDLIPLFGRIRYVSKNIGIVLVTNGILLNAPMAESLIDKEIDEVVVSLNFNDPQSYLSRMGLDAYEKIKHNIENFILLRNKRGVSRPSVFVQYLDEDAHCKSYQREIRYWLSIMKHHDKCFVHPIVNQAGFYNGSSPSTHVSLKKFPCTQPLWRIAIKINGDIYPCDPSFYSGGNKIESLWLGNIKFVSPAEMFCEKKGRRRSIIDLMRKDDYTFLSECKKCNTSSLDCNSYFKLPSFLRFGGYRWF